jgi:hypothetical protein
LAVACHDAGAANIVLAWLAARDGPCRALMQGPAARLWAERFGSAPLAGSIDEALDGAAALLSGTGWASPIEHDARRQARARGVHSIAVLDHWVNYAQRFERDGEVVWPDEFWVTDDYALAEAQRCFPGQRVHLQPNLYVEQQLREIALATRRDGPPEVLYVLEPARSDWGRGRPGEFQGLDYFWAGMGALDLPPHSVLALRPHPSDPVDKYADWIADKSDRVRLDTAGSLAQAIGQREWVAGAESFALVVALQAQRKVVCSLPPWAPPCRLPHHGLIHLKDLL